MIMLNEDKWKTIVEGHCQLHEKKYSAQVVV